MGFIDHIQFLFKCYNNSQYVTANAFDHGKNKIQIFNFWPYRGSEVMVGSEDTLQNF